MILELSSSRWSAAWFAAALLGGYAALALFVYVFTIPSSYYLELAGLVAVAAACVLIGSRISLFDRQFSEDAWRLSVPLRWYLIAVWLGFGTFAVLAWTTVDHIPLISSFQCFDTEQLAVQRELFLKGRTGWQAGFVYINAFFVGAIVPYTLAIMFVYNVRFRWLCLALFLVYTVSFLEKALFLKAMLPMAYLVLQRRIGNVIASVGVLLSMVALLFFVTVATSSLCPVGTTSIVQEGSTTASPQADLPTSALPEVAIYPQVFSAEYMAAGYQPSGTVDHLVWRILSVPLFTAKDALKVFHSQFDSVPLMGATSTFLAKMFGQERVAYERIVFAEQWGQNQTGTGSANSVYVTEAFVNFGWGGVIAFSLLIGQVFRWFSISTDVAFQSLWPVFAAGLYVAGFVGLILSNGFVVVLLFALFVRWKIPNRR